MGGQNEERLLHTRKITNNKTNKHECNNKETYMHVRTTKTTMKENSSNTKNAAALSLCRLGPPAKNNWARESVGILFSGCSGLTSPLVFCSTPSSPLVRKSHLPHRTRVFSSRFR